MSAAVMCMTESGATGPAGSSGAGRNGVRRTAALLPLLLALVAAPPALADPGRRPGGEFRDHGDRSGHGNMHERRYGQRYPPVYPQPVYVPPPVYYEPPVAPGISLFLPFNLHR